MQIIDAGLKLGWSEMLDKCVKNRWCWNFFVCALVAVFCFVMIFFAGCAQSQSLFEPHKGTKGISVSFFDNMPADEVYENSAFDIGLDIRNDGADDVDNVRFNVEAERKLIEIVSGSPFFVSLKGRSIESPVGGNVIKTVSVRSDKIIASEEYDTNLRVSYCYPYRTVFSAPVCIDPDVAGRKADKPELCKKKEFSFYGGQGAPVAVVKMSVQMIPKEDGVEPGFSFEVENSGAGHVIPVDDSSIANACSAAGIPSDVLGVIEIAGADFGGDDSKLVCSKSKLRTPEKKDSETEYSSERAVVRCTGSIIPYTKEAYVSYVSAELKYGYQDSVGKEVKIIKEVS